MKILLIFAHSYWGDSKVNRKLLESIKDFDNVTIHNLNDIYKERKIDNVKSEIDLLREADKIIFQFPLFWYSMPSLLKEWEDTVLSDLLHKNDNKFLEGKTFKIITTAGGDKSHYDSLEFDMNALLSHITSSFKHFGLKTEDTLCFYGAKEDNIDLNEYSKCFK
ncbi:NAD(P)H-dependent oxidoreductase [uncultured Brachyspira sp.]|uniref:NAD(P)H-dependent oxidoreductase n=1 Tax=uncultured Brachyspira sp. TaxID=221953 RepID=UPI0025FA8E44|nr:NAD(P)H-dependent oxidoreductase [uncultured Brachyspira sp.]